MRAVNPEADFETASNPEFLREGEAVKDFMSPDRIVIGVASQRSAAVLQRLYRPQQLAGVPLEVTGPETAELTKYACNSFLATKVDRKSTRLNSSHKCASRIPSSACTK